MDGRRRVAATAASSSAGALAAPNSRACRASAAIASSFAALGTCQQRQSCTAIRRGAGPPPRSHRHLERDQLQAGSTAAASGHHGHPRGPARRARAPGSRRGRPRPARRPQVNRIGPATVFVFATRRLSCDGTSDAFGRSPPLKPLSPRRLPPSARVSRAERGGTSIPDPIYSELLSVYRLAQPFGLRDSPGGRGEGSIARKRPQGRSIGSAHQLVTPGGTGQSARTAPTAFGSADSLATRRVQLSPRNRDACGVQVSRCVLRAYGARRGQATRSPSAASKLHRRARCGAAGRRGSARRPRRRRLGRRRSRGASARGAGRPGAADARAASPPWTNRPRTPAREQRLDRLELALGA